MNRERSPFGIGIYTVSEATSLTGVSAARIKRWIAGYTFKTAKGERHRSKPVWTADFEPIDGAIALSFKDMIEIRFVDSFLKAGVSWKELRDAASKAAELLDDTHPFSTYRFKTDGRTIFAEVGESLQQSKMLELTKNQYVFRNVIAPSLFEGLEYEGDELRRWRPKQGNNLVVLDPHRSFGQPITDRNSIPTKVLAAAVAAEGDNSEQNVARWYDVSVKEVSAAVSFEKSLDHKKTIRMAA